MVLLCLKHKIPIYHPDSNKEIYPHTELERRAKYSGIVRISYKFDADISFLFLKHSLYDKFDITICGCDLSSEAYGDKAAEKLMEIEKREKLASQACGPSNDPMPYGHKLYGERMAIGLKRPLEAIASLNGYDIFFVDKSSRHTASGGGYIQRDISFALNNRISSVEHVCSDSIQQVSFRVVHLSGNNKNNAVLQKTICEILNSLKDSDQLMRTPSCALRDSERRDRFLSLYHQSKEIVGTVRIEERKGWRFICSTSAMFVNNHTDLRLVAVKGRLRKELKHLDVNIRNEKIEEYIKFLYFNDFEYYKDKKKRSIEQDYFIFDCDEYCKLYHHFDHAKGEVAWLNNLKKFRYDIKSIEQFPPIANFDDAKKWLISYYENLMEGECDTNNKIQMHLYTLLLKDNTYENAYAILKIYPSIGNGSKSSDYVKKQCNNYIKKLKRHASKNRLPYIDFKDFPSSVRGRGKGDEKKICESLVKQMENRYNFL
jgi:hypothetical protein